MQYQCYFLFAPLQHIYCSGRAAICTFRLYSRCFPLLLAFLLFFALFLFLSFLTHGLNMCCYEIRHFWICCGNENVKLSLLDLANLYANLCKFPLKPSTATSCGARSGVKLPVNFLYAGKSYFICFPNLVL